MLSDSLIALIPVIGAMMPLIYHKYQACIMMVQNVTVPRYANETNMYGELKEYPALSVALEGKVIAERESLFTRLKDTTTELVSSF